MITRRFWWAIFSLGFAVGVTLTYWTWTWFSHTLMQEPIAQIYDHIVFVVAIVLGFTGAGVFWQLPRHTVIIATSWFGSNL
eukprot:COSAG02_NODE_23453_length_718_cov_1.231018_2_plen_80_part_01